MQDFEKLGVFYLGREVGAADAKDRPLVLYDSKDLVTHAVCVGMTGSGKTGLCIGLLEEAALDGVPAVVIDPKGDLANLLLTFPDLKPSDFLPWVNEDDARKKAMTPEQYAEQQAAMWKKGLADWGQDGERIRRLRDAAEFVIYTPGSSAGIPVSILKSFDAPAASILEDPDLLRERITTTVTSLLSLLGIEADPLKSREHILLCSILEALWGQGRSLDMAGLIRAVMEPPVSRVGVFDLEAFFPAKDRHELAMKLNNFLASPAMKSWTEGEPIDLQRMLYGKGGKPRMAIFSIAHLGDAERMFFVSLLLLQVLGWVRSQSGTTSLRALLYMDEIFGYLPPVANPPSKAPILTLLKQARAFGFGVVLSTQNPVDLDYKALSNAGTWLIGRLQTEQDQQRVLDGLEGAAAGAGARFDRRETMKILAGLKNRTFLMNNVHEDRPVLFESRWAMSYLRGPLTRDQIKKLQPAYKPARPRKRRRRPAAERRQRRRDGGREAGCEGGGRRSGRPPGHLAVDPPVLRARAEAGRGRRDPRVRGRVPGHREAVLRRRQGGPVRRAGRGRGGRHLARAGPARMGRGRPRERPGQGPRDRPGARCALRSRGRGAGRPEELRRVEPGFPGVAVPQPVAEALPQPVAGPRLEAGRVRAGLPHPAVGSRAGSGATSCSRRSGSGTRPGSRRCRSASAGPSRPRSASRPRRSSRSCRPPSPSGRRSSARSRAGAATPVHARPGDHGGAGRGPDLEGRPGRRSAPRRTSRRSRSSSRSSRRRRPSTPTCCAARPIP